MNIFDLLESPGMGRPRDTNGVQSAADQSAASVIGSGTTKREEKKKPVTMMGSSVKESVEEAAVKPNFKMPPESLQDKMYRQHQELRKQRGAPSAEEYKQRIAQKQAEIDALKESSYASDKNYQEAPEYKNYKIYVGKKPFVKQSTGEKYYIAVTNIGKEEIKQKGNTAQDAVAAVQEKIDFVLNAQQKVSANATLDFNVKFATDILSSPREPFFAKVENRDGEPKLIIASKDWLDFGKELVQLGFKPSALRIDSESETSTPLPSISYTKNQIANTGLIANGRYEIGHMSTDEDGFNVFDLTYHSTAHTKSDRLRLSKPAVTVGTNRTGGVNEGILDRAAPKLPKPRNPADQVLQTKVNAGGRHLDKKRRQELNPKHKHQDPLEEGAISNAIASAALAGSMALGGAAHAGEPVVGQGQSQNMQMAVDMAKHNAKIKYMKTVYGDNFQDKQMPEYRFGKVDLKPGKDGGYQATVPIIVDSEVQNESLRPGEHHTWTVHFADGTSQQVNVPSDEFDVRAYFAKRNKQVVKVDRNYAIQGQQYDAPKRSSDDSGERADRDTKAHVQHDRGLTEQELEEEFRLGKKLGTRRDRFKSLRKRKDGILGEFDSGEEGFGPFKVYLEGHLVDKFDTFDEAKEEIEFLKDADPRTANGSWKIEDGTGETVWEHDPGEMYDQMRRAKKIQITPDRKMNESQVTKITDYDLWLDEVKALGAEIHPQKDRNVFVAQSWDGDVIGKFHLGKGYGFINRSGELDETIRKINSQYRLLSKKGKNLGTFDTKAGAEKHEREVQYFKHKGMSEATGDDKFDSIMGKIGSDPWTKIFSNPNFDENIEAFCERPLSKFEQKMSQMDIEVSEDGDTLNPLWLKYYIPFSTKMAQKFISQHKLNPNDPDLVMKVRHFIDWQANEGEPAGLLSGHKLPLDTVKVDDPRWDDAMDQMRPGMDKIFPDGNKREPNPRKLDPGMMEDMDEGWKGKLAGAALAGAAALGGGDVDAQNIDLPGPQAVMIAHVQAEVNGREVNRTVNLGTKYQSEEQAERDLEEYMQSKGITRYSIRVEQKYDQSTGYGQQRRSSGYATGGDYATAPIYAPGLGDMVAGRISRELRGNAPDRGGYATGGSNKGERPRDGSQWWRDQLPRGMREEALEEDIERHLLQMRRAGYDIVQEEWSDKYKRSINCSHPKGFSQKAHCAGKKKHNESIEMEMVCEDCGMCETHGNISEEKVRLDPKCWKGKKIGNPKTKMKGGVRVNNCVPK